MYGRVSVDGVCQQRHLLLTDYFCQRMSIMTRRAAFVPVRRLSNIAFIDECRHAPTFSIDALAVIMPPILKKSMPVSLRRQYNGRLCTMSIFANNNRYDQQNKCLEITA